ELEVGEHILIEDYQSVAVWHGCVTRAGGNLVVLTDEHPPPVDLKPNAPVRVCFSEQRWLTKVRGRVLERDNHTVKILLVGQDERVQRRAHVRAPLHESTRVTVTRRDVEPQEVDADIVDVSEGGFQLRSQAPFFVGDAVQLTCTLNATSVQLTGQVVRSWRDADHHVAGVRAIRLSPAAQSNVARYVIESSLVARRADALGSRRAIAQ
ncbi:MAG: PilZ domain-containing protein, partial [Terracidiphilus sp.]